MKKILLLTVVLMLLVVPVAFAEEEVTEVPVSKFRSVVKISADTMGEIEGSEYGYTETFDVETSFSISSEFSKRTNPNLDAGVGITVQMPRSVEDSIIDVEWHFIPVYGLVRAFPSPETNPIYVTGQAGWNYFNGNGSGVDYSGGLYLGAGVGYLSDKFLAELLWSKNKGGLEGYGSTADVDYSKVSLSVGLVF